MHYSRVLFIATVPRVTHDELDHIDDLFGERGEGKLTRPRKSAVLPACFLSFARSRSHPFPPVVNHPGYTNSRLSLQPPPRPNTIILWYMVSNLLLFNTTSRQSALASKHWTLLRRLCAPLCRHVCHVDRPLAHPTAPRGQTQLAGPLQHADEEGPGVTPMDGGQRREEADRLDEGERYRPRVQPLAAERDCCAAVTSIPIIDGRRTCYISHSCWHVVEGLVLISLVRYLGENVPA